jgi:hypothetical protein
MANAGMKKLARAASMAMGLWVAAAACSLVQARSVALLVGVNDYGNPRLNLEGPVNDVQALRDVLVRRWGFAANDVHVLINAQATKAAIMQELRALKQRSAPGDEVVIYFSGHGTSALDSTARLPVPHGSGAFIPSGLDTSSAERMMATLVVGKTDLRPAIESLEKDGRKLWVISDSCYAGNQVRSVVLPTSDTLPTKMIPLILSARDQVSRERDEQLAAGRPVIEPYPYKSTAYLSASAEGERARDIPAHLLARFPTVDGKAHGAMTDALLRVLEGQLPADYNQDGRLDLNEVHRAVSDYMADRAYGHTPQRLPAVAEDANGLGTRAVLAATGVAAKPAQAQVSPLAVRLDPALPARIGVAVGAAPDVKLVSSPSADIHLVDRGGKLLFATSGGDFIAEADPADLPRIQAQVRQLAWAKRLRSLAEANRRGALAFDIAPAEFGGNLHIGDFMHFVVRPAKETWLVVVNINADGKVAVLYPARAFETAPLPANTARAIPGDSGNDLIKVVPPVGMDIQLAFAFEAKPEGLERIVGLDNVDPSDGRLAVLERMVSQMKGQFSFANTSLRVFGPRKKG